MFFFIVHEVATNSEPVDFYFSRGLPHRCEARKRKEPLLGSELCVLRLFTFAAVAASREGHSIIPNKQRQQAAPHQQRRRRRCHSGCGGRFAAPKNEGKPGDSPV